MRVFASVLVAVFGIGGLAAWLLLGLGNWADAPVWLAGAGRAVPVVWLPVPGLLLGLSLGLVWLLRGDIDDELIVFAIGAVALALLLGMAAAAGAVRPLTAALAFVLGGVTWLVALRTLRMLVRDEGVRFESHWGGLGGGMGGWRLSTGAVLAVLLSAMVGTFALVAVIDPGKGPGDGDKAGAKAEPARTPAAGSAETPPASSAKPAPGK